VIINFEHFFKHNKDLLKIYSDSPSTIDTSSPSILTINT
jgi:hypothetical protein